MPDVRNGQGRDAAGRYQPGVSGCPGGLSIEERRARREIAELARGHCHAAVRRLKALMEHKNGRVALGACLAMLKVGGVLNEATELQIEREIQRRLREMIAAAEAEASRPITVEPAQLGPVAP